MYVVSANTVEELVENLTTTCPQAIVQAINILDILVSYAVKYF